MWFWFDEQTVSVSTLAHRRKYRNLLRDNRVAFTVVDPARPLRYLEIRRTIEVSEDT